MSEVVLPSSLTSQGSGAYYITGGFCLHDHHLDTGSLNQMTKAYNTLTYTFSLPTTIEYIDITQHTNGICGIQLFGSNDGVSYTTLTSPSITCGCGVYADFTPTTFDCRGYSGTYKYFQVWIKTLTCSPAGGYALYRVVPRWTPQALSCKLTPYP